MYLNYKKVQEYMDRNIEDVLSFHSVTVKKEDSFRSTKLNISDGCKEFYIIYSDDYANVFLGIYETIPYWYSNIAGIVKSYIDNLISVGNMEIEMYERTIKECEQISEINKPKHKKGVTYWDDTEKKVNYCNAQSKICDYKRRIKEVERTNERAKEYTINDFVYHNPNTDHNTSFHMRKISVGENIESLGNFWNVTKRNMR